MIIQRRRLHPPRLLLFASLLSLVLIFDVDGAIGSAPVAAAREVNYKVWPMPKWSSNGRKKMYLNPGDFKLVMAPGTNYTDPSGILTGAFSRMLDLLTLSHAFKNESSSSDRGRAAALPRLAAVRVLISSPDDTLQYGIDESYQLSVPSRDKSNFAHIEASTLYGALHGLQTFSQLCHFDLVTKVVQLEMVPWVIIDQPRFFYRGLLIDTARHYQPISMIKKIIDSMTYTKLNVLHWHIVDTQSFPLEIPSFPKLWNGAYSASERYSASDAEEIVRYAESRGVHVLAEIDVPGHALSWGVGYPSLWPSRHCQEPLDVSKDFTFKVIDGILSDFSKIFKFKFVHLGGDEVNTGCWNSTPHIKKWLKEHHMNASQAYQYFVLRAQRIAISHGFEIINWEETFKNFGSKLSRQTVVHNWLGGNVAPKVVASGLRCIVSNQNKWYLDHLNVQWEDFYMNEPLANITDPQQQKLVIGGEVCLWGETVDRSDIEQTIWPRAAAAAERLWTPYNMLAKDPNQVTKRLTRFRCLLNERGIAAAPVLSGYGRGAPLQPGSCFM